MQFHDVTDLLTPSRYAPSEALAGDYETDAVLTVALRPGQTPHRFTLGFVSTDGHCCRVTGGPVLPGPYAYAVGLPTCISADPRMSTGVEMSKKRDAGLVIDAELGDVLVFPGSLWRIDRTHNDNVKLVQVQLVPATATATAADAAYATLAAAADTYRAARAEAAAAH